MKARLLEGLSEQEQMELRSEFTHCRRLRQRVRDILTKDIDTLVVSMCNDEHFQSDWAYVQADRVAQVKALRKLISLFSD